MDNIEENIRITLSEEEKDFLKKIREKIKKELDNNKADPITSHKPLDPDQVSGLLHDPNLLLDDPIHPKHITNYAREINVEFRMEMTAVNEEGRLVEVSQLVHNFYHIPVPSGADHVPIVSGFVENFDSNLLNCARKIHKPNAPTEIHI